MNSILNPLLVQVMGLGYFHNMYRGKPVLKKGGVMILTHPCYDEFDHDQHPSYIEFFNRLLPETRDAMALRHKYEEEFAHNPSYIEMYRRGNAYHGAHPFFMWYWGENGRQHVGKVIVGGRAERARAGDAGLGSRGVADRGDRDGEQLRRPVAGDHDDAPPADRHGGHGVSAQGRASPVSKSTMIKLKSPGRGGQFSIARGIAETLQRVIFAGRWPARVLDRVPAATRVQLIEHELHLSDGDASAGAELAPLRLAFISDLHIGPLTPPKLLDNAFQLLARWLPTCWCSAATTCFLDVNAGHGARAGRTGRPPCRLAPSWPCSATTTSGRITTSSNAPSSAPAAAC